MMSPTASTVLTIVRRVAIVIAFIVVVLQPGFGRAEAPTQASDVDVIVVIDSTRSMAALDYEDREPRIEGVKKDLVELSEELPGARFGIISFGSKARLTLPITTDVLAFQSAVETFDLEGPRDGNGSAPERATDELIEVLERAEEQRPEQRRFVVFVGDGEATEGTVGDSEHASFADVGEKISGGTVLGYGTTDGATMPESDDLYDDDLVEDPETGQSAVSKADLDKLEEIAKQLNVTFHHRTEPGGVKDIADSFDAAYDNGSRDDGKLAKKDATWIAGLVLLSLLLFELYVAWRAAWTAGRALAPATTKGAGK